MRLLFGCLLLIATLSLVVALQIAAFNIRRLSANLVKDHDVRDRLATLLQRNDITVIEEVMDHAGLEDIVKTMNSHGTPYHAIFSQLEGRTSYKEHYAFVYRTDRVSVMGTYQYPDTANHFERPPFSAKFHAASSALSTFVLTACHIKPADAKTEIGHLVEVYEDVSKHFGTQNVMLAGDFNADCSYLSKTALSQNALYKDSRFLWLISSEVDTTTSNSDCAYDRFVVAGTEFKANVVPGSAKPFNLETGLHITYQQAWATSDHYPIEMQLKNG